MTRAWSCCCSRRQRLPRKATDDRPPTGFMWRKELRRRSVTRLLLWEEYRAANPDGFGYTWFCTTFEAWKKRATEHAADPHGWREGVRRFRRRHHRHLRSHHRRSARHEAVRRGDG